MTATLIVVLLLDVMCLETGSFQLIRMQKAKSVSITKAATYSILKGKKIGCHRKTIFASINNSKKTLQLQNQKN